ncbi:hypothetical protein [Noviherbaspirillum sp.]
MPRTLHTKIRLGGNRYALFNARRAQTAACIGATVGISLVMLAVQIFR